MSTLFKPFVGLSMFAALLAIVGIVLIAQPDQPQAETPATDVAADQSPNPVLAKPGEPAPEPEPENVNVSPPVEDSSWQVTNASVTDLMSGTLLARDRDDQAYLARCMESTAGKPTLVEDDVLAGYRQFMWRSTKPGWDRIIDAWQARTYEIVEDGDSAELILQVGGALGEMRVKFVRIDNAWYFAGI